MNQQDVDKQVNQMVDFIIAEAREKAHEISVKATEDFNIEKLRLVEQEKVKIRQEYERKEKQVDIQKKIAYSNEVNQARLKVLRARDQVLESVRKDVHQRIARASQDGSYKNLIRDLTIQALLRLMETKVVVRCREADAQVVQSVFAEAAAAFQKVSGKSADISLDRSNWLAPSPDKVAEGAKSCCGGVVVQTADGKIVCDNTLDARERIAMFNQLPEIKIGLFGASATRTHVD